jgi:hypothetical protein
MSDVFNTNKKLLIRSLLLGIFGSMIVSLFFAIFDTFNSIFIDRAPISSEIRSIVLTFIIGFIFSIIPALICGYILAELTNKIKNKYSSVKFKWTITISGGILGIIIGFVLIVFTEMITNFRMPLSILYHRVIIVELLSLVVGLAIGRLLSIYSEKLSAMFLD